jgi:cytochrome b involved in lipid metabolism
MGVGIFGDRVPLVTVASVTSNDATKKLNCTGLESALSVPSVMVSKGTASTNNISLGPAKIVKNENEGEPYLPRWGRILKAVMIAGIVVYMIYKDQCLNIYLLFGRFVHLLLFPIISLRDIDAPTNKPTTVEYNVQTHALVGLLSYTIALLFLWMNTTNPIAMWFASLGRTQPYMALSVTAGFENNDKLFTLCFCRPFDFSAKKVMDRVFQELLLPICLASLLVLQSVNELDEYNYYITMVATTLFAYRMLILTNDYQLGSAAKTETIPMEMVFTQGVTRDYSTTAFSNPPGHEHVWRIYGNEYDVTDFIQHHPGGVESIMLGANRDDCTAVFQSYHAFNIKKAKAVLEKYRISSKTSPEEENKLQGRYPVGHHNDLFYEELVKRVSKKLLENGVDPVKDRYASWGRYFVYAIVMTCIVVSGYYHLTVSRLYDRKLGNNGR